MDIKQALTQAIFLLKENKIQSPAVDAGILLCHTIRKDKVFIFSHDEYVLDKEEERLFSELISCRSQGVPVQYLTGKQEFMSLKFKVGPGVLIPRQDTEILAEAAIELIKLEPGRNLKMLDLCTGSGCIALSVAYYAPDASVVAADISESALRIAEFNCRELKLEDRVIFVQSDLFDNLNGAFDIIVSNPPYIPTGDINGLQREVCMYEPAEALDGGKDGLDFYRRIISQARRYLNKQGVLLLEAGIGQARAVEELMGNAGFAGLEILKDLSGVDRVIKGWR